MKIFNVSNDFLIDVNTKAAIAFGLAIIAFILASTATIFLSYSSFI